MVFSLFILSFSKSIEVGANSISNEYLPTYANQYLAEDWIEENGDYQYPMTPEHEQWAQMIYLEQILACNMPEELISVLSTEELVRVALEYPFMIDFLLFDSYEQGVSHLRNTSNIYDELFMRNDIGYVLIEAYNALNVNYDLLLSNEKNALSNSEYDKEVVLQLLLASEDIFKTLDAAQLSSLVDIIGDKQEEKKGKCDDYVTSFTFYHAYAETNETIPFELIPDILYDSFLEAEEIVSRVSEFTSSGTTVTASSGASYYSGTYTLYGVSIECLQYLSGDYSSTEMQKYNNALNLDHSNWTYISTATKKYNCHSYCWINKSASNIYWLNDPRNFASATSYFNSYGGNIQIASSDAYIIIYDIYGPAHSVRSISTSSGSNTTSWMTTTNVVSKLGTLGVYQTTLYDMYIFYSGTYYTVYTKK